MCLQAGGSKSARSYGSRNRRILVVMHAEYDLEIFVVLPAKRAEVCFHTADRLEDCYRRSEFALLHIPDARAEAQ